MRATRDNILTYLADIKNELAKDGIVSLALFGSFAKNEQSVYSDIDIAIKKEKDYLKKRTAYNYFEEVAKIKEMIRKKFHRNSDVFDMKKSVEEILMKVK